MRRKQIAVIVSGFPRLSETFAINELLALEERGALAAIFATKPGDGSNLQPGHKRLLPLVTVLPQGSAADQGSSAAALLRRCKPGAVHGYFAHTPAEVAMHAAEQLRVPFGLSVHARDARKLSAEELARRAQKAACVVACNTDVSKDIRHLGTNVHLIPHGVDLQRFKAKPTSANRVLKILAIGRLVEKKGFHFLIAAVARLVVPFQLRIVGDGPEADRLSQLISLKGLSDRVSLRGRKAHDELPAEYARADVVVVPSILDRTGDRDGLPNVVLEAMASGRAVVGSNAGAITSAIVDGKTGLVVRPADPVSLARALTRLAADKRLREELGRNARTRVERDYEIGHCTERFCQLLKESYA